MDGSNIGDYSIILPDTLIPPGKKFNKFSLLSGSPAKLIKKIDLDYYNKISNLKSKFNINYKKFLKDINPNYQSIKLDKTSTFISPDALIGCNIFTKPNSSIWFSTVFHSPNNKGIVNLGAGSNIQDNSIFNTKGNLISIGERVTVGHNVIINGECRIYDDAVIGMGSILEENCTVEKNAFVGANSYVKKNTVIPEGEIYAGNPAKFFREITQQEREFFSLGQKIYEKLTQEYIRNLYS
jgi:carbonic anhydrase/acetyltransferase-like protein (isoleucine patch superfamily)